MAINQVLPTPSLSYQQRVNQLNNLLREKFGARWDLVLETNCIRSIHNLSNSDLSKFHLLANYIIRVLTIEGYEEAKKSLLRLVPIEHCSIIAMPGTLILNDNPVIKSDLLKIQHPSLPSGSVTPSTLDHTYIYAEDLDVADTILDFVPDLKAEALNFFGSICFVVSPKLQRTGECISTSSKYVPGLIYTSEVPPILLAEAIIHEAAHLQLFCREIAADLYNDNDCSIETPLRPDLRPPAGLLHQVFVLTRLCAFYEMLTKTESQLLTKSVKQIQKRFINITSEFENGKNAIKENRSRYTTAGNNLIDLIV